MLLEAFSQPDAFVQLACQNQATVRGEPLSLRSTLR